MTASTFGALGEAALPGNGSPGLAVIERMLRGLDGRFAELLGSSAEPSPLRGLVITPSEVDSLLSGRGSRHAGWETGSLWGGVAADAAAARESGFAVPLEVMRERFRLSPFEVECVAACLAPELDARYQKLYSFINDDITRRYPTAHVLARLLASPDDALACRKLLLPSGVLLRSGILVFGEDAAGPASLNRCLQVESGVVQYLLEDFQASPGLQPVWADPEYPRTGDELTAASYTAAIGRHLQRWFESRKTQRERLVCILSGRPGSGRRHAAEQACSRAGLGLMPLDGRRLLRRRDAETVLAHAFRDSLLHGAPLLISHFDSIAQDLERGPDIRFTLERLMEDLGWVLFLCTHEAGRGASLFPRCRVAEIAFDPPDETARAEWWRDLLSSRAGLDGRRAGKIAYELAARYRLTAGQTGLVFERASGEAPAEPEAWRAALHRIAAEISAPRLGELAQKVRPSRRWDDLVLPDYQKDLVRDVIRQIRFRRTVFEEWRFREKRTRLQGIVALFSGLPGTGKSMAAEVIAHTLRMDMYRIDLANVVSKYIGETEKNLFRIFREAEHTDAILFFDEADALFGKRSEVKDAHDRYANIEINYLLQQLESFEGVAILATNLRQNMDDAFLRRVHIVVEFPMPSPEDRLRIWRGCLPADAPLDEDADLAYLANRFEVSGGHISNVVLTAAYLAAEEHAAIGMRHFAPAMRRELEKIGKRTVAEEFGAYAKWLHFRAGGAPELEMED